MAKQLDFIVIDMGAPFVGTTVTEEQLLEVPNELGFGELYLATGPARRVRDRLRAQLGPYITEFLPPGPRQPMNQISPTCPADFGTKSSSRVSHLINDLRNANRANGNRANGNRGGW